MTAPRRALAYGLTVNVVLLALVSLLTDVSSEMILPILPFWRVGVLLAGALVLGVVEGLADGVVSFMKILSGRWSDEAGHRRRFVAAGYGLSTAMKALFPFAASWPQFLGMRIGERAGKGVRDAPRGAPGRARGAPTGAAPLLGPPPGGGASLLLFPEKDTPPPPAPRRALRLSF